MKVYMNYSKNALQKSKANVHATVVKMRDLDQNDCERFVPSNNAKAMKFWTFTFDIVEKVLHVI